LHCASCTDFVWEALGAGTYHFEWKSTCEESFVDDQIMCCLVVNQIITNTLHTGSQTSTNIKSKFI
jgi:hypothetical protein